MPGRIIALALITFLTGYIIALQNPQKNDRSEGTYKQVFDIVFDFLDTSEKQEIANCIESDQFKNSEEIKKCLRGKSLDSAKNANFLARTFAVEADIISLNNCIPDPIVTKLELGQMITIKNNSSQKTTLLVTDDQQFTIEPNASIEIKADFGYGHGGYAFFCKENPTAGQEVGMFYITQK